MSHYEDGQSDSETFGLLDSINSSSTNTSKQNQNENGHYPNNRTTVHSPGHFSSSNIPQQRSTLSSSTPTSPTSTTSIIQNTINSTQQPQHTNQQQQQQQRRVLRPRYSLDNEQSTQPNKLILACFGGITIIISLLLITIYTIKASSTQPIPPLYRHVSTFGPKFRVEHELNDDGSSSSTTKKDDFFPSVWLPTVDRSTIVETLLSQTQTELWVPTSSLHQSFRMNNEQIPIFNENDLKTLISNDYPPLDSIFVSTTPSTQSFPLTLPTSKQPISTHINLSYTPIHTIYMIQFYAHWCGHCRRFSSHAENLAHTFNSKPNSPIRMLRVHCADLTKQGQQLCQALNIGDYPTIYIGTARSWLWVLNQIMPEFHQRLQLWYVRSRGSSPPPGQGTIDTSSLSMKQIDKNILTTLLTRIPSSQSTADAVVTWVNNWLIEQYDKQKVAIHSITTNNNGGNTNINDINFLQSSIIATQQQYLNYYNKHIFELNPKTKQEIDNHNAQSISTTKIQFKSVLNGMEKKDLTKLTPIELEKLQKELLHRAGDYELNLMNTNDINSWLLYGLPLDDMISYIIMPQSILTGTLFFHNMKPTRYYDPRINFNIRPSIIQGIYSGASIYLPIKYSVLSEDELKIEMLRDVSKGSNDDNNSNNNSNNKNNNQNNGGKTINNIYMNGYPDKANILDQMSYWSIALREAIPQCHRAQMLAFQTNNSQQQSNKDDNEINLMSVKLQSLVKLMQEQLSNGYRSDINQYQSIPIELLYTSPTETSSSSSTTTKSNGDDNNDNDIDPTKINAYINGQTCYEALYDMLDMLCVLATKTQIDQQQQQSPPTNFKDIWPLEKQCQLSFCQLKSNLNQYLLPPTTLSQLYLSHSLTGIIPPILELNNDKTNLPQFKHVQEHWELCFKPWSYWDNLDWQQCKGSSSYTRGYTCGLWLNLHTLSISFDYHVKHNTLPIPITKSPTTKIIPSASKFALIIRHYFKHFFLCQECQKHFLSYSNELPFLLSSTFPIKLTTTLPQTIIKGSNGNNNNDDLNNNDHKEEDSHTEGVTAYSVSFPPNEYLPLWLWHTHNVVNQRLALVEKQHSAADPIFPKIYFPLYHKCIDCRDSTSSSCTSSTSNNVVSTTAPTTTTTTTTTTTPTPTSSSNTISNLSDNCLWDDHWNYYNTYDYLVKFYSPAV